LEKRIAFIGYGEAAYHISSGLSRQGFSNMVAYDIGVADPARGSIIKAHAVEANVNLVSTMREAVDQAGFIISLTSSKVAVEVAESVLPLLKPGQVFMDFNSASPVTKQRISELPRPEGVKFCDVAVMSAVPLQGSKVPLLLSGEGGDEFYDQMKPYGMNIEVLSAPAGGASAVKMVRSIFMKGYPQVLMECLLAAEAYGVTEKIIDSIEASIGGMDTRQLANRFFTPTILHAARRASEMKEVVSMLEDMRHDSTMSEASRMSHENLSRLGLESEIGADDVVDYRELIPMILNKHKSRNH